MQIGCHLMLFLPLLLLLLLLLLPVVVLLAAALMLSGQRHHGLLFWMLQGMCSVAGRPFVHLCGSVQLLTAPLCGSNPSLICQQWEGMHQSPLQTNHSGKVPAHHCQRQK
jgi:hypothetical protein